MTRDEATEPRPPEQAERYRTDCRRCKGLCCIVPAHIPDNGFPTEKPANQHCRHLSAEHRCRIFARLETEGYTVCRAYDCHGAGPLVSNWIDADGGAAAARGERLEDFRQLARLHLLAMAVRGNGDDARALFDALDQVSLAYRRDGVFDMTRQARELLRGNQALVEAVLGWLEER